MEPGAVPSPTLTDVVRTVLRAVAEGRSVAVVTEVPSGGGDAGPLRRLVVGEVETEGGLGSPERTRAAETLARRALTAPEEAPPGLHRIRPAGEPGVEVFLEVHHPDPELVIAGGGHIARPLCRLGALLGLRVTVLDDRPGFAEPERFPEADRVLKVDFAEPFAELRLHRRSHVVLVTRGHRYDYECLRAVLRHDPLPGYVGMIGSRRRVRATFRHLLEEGIGRERLAAVHAPVGLDLGAEGPEEIALSIAAEIVLRRRGGTGRPLRDVERILDRHL